MEAADEAGGGEAAQAAQDREQQQDLRAEPAWVPSVGVGGTKNAGCEPRNSRPMKVAVPVDSATGRKVRALTSGSISSMANSTPPIGVLKVAAMPAPAPAATRVMRCHAAMRISWPRVEPNDGADLDDRALAADRAAGADRRAPRPATSPARPAAG